MMWFNKHHPNTIYMDKYPRPEGCIEQQPFFECKPDIEGDFTAIPFPDASFKLVVFDPPHAEVKLNSITGLKYGTIDDLGNIKKGLMECMRVLEPYGVLIFKWCEVKYTVTEVLDKIGFEPLFGHVTGKAGKTKWMCFIKAPEGGERD